MATARKTEAVDLQVGPARLRQILAAMPEGFALGETVVDARGRPCDFRLLEANDAFWEQTGLRRDIIGRPAHEWAAARERSWADHFCQVARSGRPDRFTSSDGSGDLEVDCFSPSAGQFALIARDVSARTRVERALQESEVWQRQLIDSLPGLLWTADPQGEVDFVSPQWEAYTGLAAADLRGRGWLEVLHPEDRQTAWQAWTQAVANRAAYAMEYRLRRHDGSYRWFICRSTPILDAKGRIERWFGKCTDIDELKRSQEALRESEQRYASLFNNQLIGLAHLRVVTNDQGQPVDLVFERVNAAYERLVGRLRAEVEGRRVTAVFPGIEQFGNDRIQLYGNIALQGGEHNVELYFPPTGQWFLVYVYSHEPGCCTLIFSDITAQKQAESALRESEGELKAAFDQAAVGMAHTSPHGDWLRVNHAFCNMLGYDEAEMIGRNFRDFVHPDDVTLHSEEGARLRYGELDTFTVEKRYRHKQGGIVWLRVTVTAVRDGRGAQTQKYNLVIAEDITERRQAELARAASEAELRATFDQAAVGIAHIGPDRRFLRVNRKLCNMLGYTEEELLQKRVMDVTYPPDREIGLADFDRSIRGELDSYTADKRYLGKDGRLRWVRITGAPVKDPDSGRIRYNVAIIEDITERKRAQAELEGFFRQAATGMAVGNAEGRLLRVNERFCTITGYSEVELRALTFQELTHPDDLAESLALFRRMMIGEIGDFTLEKRYLRKQGGYVWATISVAVVRNAGDTSPYVVSVIQDITARKQLEQELQQAHQELEARVEQRTAELRDANAALRFSEERSRLVLETATDAYVAVDANGLIAEWNQAAEVMFGWQRQEVIGRSVTTTIIPVRYRPQHARSFARFTQTGQSELMHHPLELAALRRDGSEFPVELSLSAARFDGQWLISSFLRDISARKQAEAALQQAIRDAEAERERARSAQQLAEAASQAKTEFLATLSHEIRTPLNGVIGFNGLLLDGPLNEEKRRYAELARHSGESLLHLLNDFLDFSKIEAGRLELEPMDFDLHLEVGHVLALVQEGASEKGLRLSHSIDAPDHLRGDAARLRQILLNLLGNAVKFTARGHVHLSCEEVLRRGHEVWICFQVNDTGIGIDPSVRERLFQPFAQADASTTRQFGGTGLGLAISRRLASAMGGKIGFTSVPGAGSTFWVELPFTLLAHKPDLTPEFLPVLPELAEGVQRGRVLVAEDNPVSQLLATEIFKRLGCQVDVVGNGKEAVEAFKHLPYDIIFMDCDMPVMNGFDATCAIRALALPEQHVPIIAMTASVLQGDVERCIAVGMDDFMSKPLRLHHIAEIVDKWLKKAKGHPPPGVDR